MNRYERANDLVSAGVKTEEWKQEREAARAAMDSAKADLEQSRGYLLAVLTAECDAEEIERLNRFRASGGDDVPTALRVMGFTSDGWQEVAAAWRLQERTNAGVYRAEDADLSALTGVAEDADVQAADQRLQADLESLRVAFADYSG